MAADSPGTHLKRIDLHDKLITAHEGGGGNDGGARSIDRDEHPYMFDDHPDQVNVFSKAGSLVLGDMRILHAAHENKKSTRRNLLLIWHSRPQTVPDFWKEEGRPVPDWLAERLQDGPPDDLVTTRVQGTGVELELPEELQVNTAPLAHDSSRRAASSHRWFGAVLQGMGIGSLMRSEADGLLPPGAEDRAAVAARRAREAAARL